MKMIALLTDFGNSEYSGVLRGVILSCDQEIRCIDLTHEVVPHNILDGGWKLLESFEYFPCGTVFLCVVDPGVGTGRKIIAVKTNHYVFVGPDNGLMYTACIKDGIQQIYKINHRNAKSDTFHGRDVMAPAAAEIASKGNFNKFEKIDSMVELDLTPAVGTGYIVKIDRFGNIVTNLPCKEKTGHDYVVKFENGNEIELSLVRTYSDITEKKLFLIRGSSRTFEISVKDGSAGELLPEIKVGTRLSIEVLT